MIRFKKGLGIIPMILILGLTGCYNPPDTSEDDYASTLVVWDSSNNEYHKLLFHTVHINRSNITGFSLNSLQMESFQISDEDEQVFEEMKRSGGISSSEVQCTKCHVSVGKLIEK